MRGIPIRHDVCITVLYFCSWSVTPVVFLVTVVQDAPEPEVPIVFHVPKVRIGTNLGMGQANALQYGLVLHDDHFLFQKPIDGF